jgi:ubiquitin-conjugating enzyme E2 M
MEIVDINEMNLAKTKSIFFPNGKDDLLTFEITIQPIKGYY